MDTQTFSNIECQESNFHNWDRRSVASEKSMYNTDISLSPDTRHAFLVKALLSRFEHKRDSVL